VASLGKEEMHTKFWSENLLGNVYLRFREGGVSITLRWFLLRWVLRVWSEWNWLRTVYNGGLWYKRCWTFGFCYQRVSKSQRNRGNNVWWGVQIMEFLNLYPFLRV